MIWAVGFTEGGAPFGLSREEYLEATGAIRDRSVRTFNLVVERDPDTGLYVGSVPGWPGAHSQGKTIDELHQNLQDVLAMLLEDGEPNIESEFV